jgi:biotin carboxyl carrier protein
MSYHTSHRKSTLRAGGGAKLFACALLIAGAFTAKYLFPDFAESARSELRAASSDTGVNYRAAFSAMGEVLSGEAKPDAVLAALVKSGEPSILASYEYKAGSGKLAFERLGYGNLTAGGDVEAVGAIEIESVNAQASAAAETVLTFDYAVEASPDGRVYAYNDGIVVADGDSALYGKYLIIYHGDITAEYYHCTELNVKSGDTVVKGQQIALSK